MTISVPSHGWVEGDSRPGDTLGGAYHDAGLQSQKNNTAREMMHHSMRILKSSTSRRMGDGVVRIAKTLVATGTGTGTGTAVPVVRTGTCQSLPITVAPLQQTDVSNLPITVASCNKLIQYIRHRGDAARTEYVNLRDGRAVRDDCAKSGLGGGGRRSTRGDVFSLFFHCFLF
jgi:hypothetical protein